MKRIEMPCRSSVMKEVIGAQKQCEYYAFKEALVKLWGSSHSLNVNEQFCQQHPQSLAIPLSFKI